MEDHPKDEFIERNIGRAEEVLANMSDREILLPSQNDLCRVHATLFEGIERDAEVFDGQSGKFRSSTAFIGLNGGQYLHFCPPGELEAEYARFLAEMEDVAHELPHLFDAPSSDASKLQKVRYVAAFHSRLIWIHPFEDGNGRVARPFAYFQLAHLLAPDEETMRQYSSVNRSPQLPSNNPMAIPSIDQTRRSYEVGLREAAENLSRLARFFTYFCPGLPIPAHIDPPKGRVKDLRHYPPGLAPGR